MSLPTAAVFVNTLHTIFDAKHAFSQAESRAGAEGLWTLKGTSSFAVYLKSDLDLDTDGPKIPGIRYDRYHQDETALKWESGLNVNSNVTPYLVIPSGWSKGIALGDVALVQYGDRLCPAIVADIGPRAKIGEGSIALHRVLGFERVAGSRIIDVGIDSGVRTVFFPGTGEGNALDISVITARAAAAWAALTGAGG